MPSSSHNERMSKTISGDEFVKHTPTRENGIELIFKRIVIWLEV